MQVKQARNIKDVKQSYKSIGFANSANWQQPEGEWIRIFVSSNGNMEVHCNHATREYYTTYLD